MKTIDINLIGNISKSSDKTIALIEDIDERARFISIVAVTGAFSVFIVCTGIWGGSFYLSQKFNSDLTKLKSRNEKLNMELANANLTLKNLQEQKKILDFELVAQKQIDGLSLSWHNILLDIASRIPKNIKITKINKSSSDSTKFDTNLEIEGKMDSEGFKISPLEAVSYLVLNINENHSENSYLSNAVVKKIEYEEKEGLYNFIIKADLKIPENNNKKTGLEKL